MGREGRIEKRDEKVGQINSANNNSNVVLVNNNMSNTMPVSISK